MTSPSYSMSQVTDQFCKHAELISYKVHKDQFKSLLVSSRPNIKMLAKDMKERRTTKAAKNTKIAVSGGSESGLTNNTSNTTENTDQSDGDCDIPLLRKGRSLHRVHDV